MKYLVLVLTPLLSCVSNVNRPDDLGYYPETTIKIQKDKTITLYWEPLPNTESYALLYQFEIDSIWRVLSQIPKGESSLTIEREDISEDHTIFFFDLRAILNESFFIPLHFYIDSTKYFYNPIEWDTDIISLLGLPQRTRWFENPSFIKDTVSISDAPLHRRWVEDTILPIDTILILEAPRRRLFLR